MADNLVDIQSYLNELGKEIENTGEFLRKLSGARTRLKNGIIKAEDDVKLLNNPVKYVAGLKDGLEKEALQAAKDALAGKLIQALRENIEFDEAPYKKALALAIKDKDTFKVRRTGSGWSSIIKVDIDLNKSGGRLPDWGRAVKQARKALDIKVPNADNARAAEMAAKASRAWAAIFDSRTGTFSKFSKTIRLRLSFATKPAPFWIILDKGTPPAMTSDRGGTPTPGNTSTNFISGAKFAVETYMKKVLANAKVKYEEKFEQYEKLLPEAKKSLKELEDLLSELRLERGSARKLIGKLKLDKRNTDLDKLIVAVKGIQTGLLTKGAVDLSASGADKRNRKSVQLIARALLED